MSGLFTIPTRIYLSAEQRAKLDRLLRDGDRELDELLTELIVQHLAPLPEPEPEPDDGGARRREELRRRRAELRRLRPSLNDPHNPPPAWLTQMAAELEQEIARLEKGA